MSVNSTSLADKIAAMVESHDARVLSETAHFVALFEADLAANNITVDLHRERATILWVPQTNKETQFTFYSACLHALAAKTGMNVSWSGCTKCPLALRKRPVCHPRSTPVSGEVIAQVISVAAKVSRGEAITPAEGEAMTDLFTRLSALISGGGGNGCGPCYAINELPVTIGHDDTNVCAHVGSGPHMGNFRMHMMPGLNTWTTV